MSLLPCPACGSRIEDSASVCPYCHSDVRAIKLKQSKNGLIVLLSLFIIFVILSLFLSPAFLFYWVSHGMPFAEEIFNDFAKNINVWTWIGSGTFWVLIGFFFYRSRKKKEPV